MRGTLKDTLREYIAGCFTGIWVETLEPQEAIVEINHLCRNESWQYWKWDIDGGLRVRDQVVEDLSLIRI